MTSVMEEERKVVPENNNGRTGQVQMVGSSSALIAIDDKVVAACRHTIEAYGGVLSGQTTARIGISQQEEIKVSDSAIVADLSREIRCLCQGHSVDGFGSGFRPATATTVAVGASRPTAGVAGIALTAKRRDCQLDGECRWGWAGCGRR